jgi:hypothetical protein
MTNEQIKLALESADWSGVSIGNKAIIQAAISVLTSPAKAGGDEREAFEQEMRKTYPSTVWLFKRIEFPGWGETRGQYQAPYEERAWNGWQARAALSADGGEDKRDAQRYRWLRDQNDWYAEPRLDEEDGTIWKLTFYTSARIEDESDDDNLDTAVDAAIIASQGVKRD